MTDELPTSQAPAGDSPLAGASLPPESAPGAAFGGQAPRAKRAYKRVKPFRVTRARKAAARANLARGRESLRERGWPHSDEQRAVARENIRKAQAAIRERGIPNTKARRAANLSNLAKANARLRDLKYPRNEEQKGASRANLSKAHAASREPGNYRRYHRHKLKHGLQVRSLEQTLRLLGEDPREFEAHCGRFARVFAPAGPTEEKVVRRIAVATWHELRLFKAQARWQADALRRYFQHAVFVQPLDAHTTRLRALFLMSLITDREKFLFHDQRLTGAVERALRALLRLRAGGDPEFQLYSRQTEKERREYRRLEKGIEEEQRIIEQTEHDLDLQERLIKGGPEVARALARVRRNLPKKK